MSTIKRCAAANFFVAILIISAAALLSNTVVNPNEVYHKVLFNGFVFLVYQDGNNCITTEYRNATDPTYDEVIDFVKGDETQAHPYEKNYVCANYAVDLHDNAEKHGIKAHVFLVGLDDQGEPALHMIVGFNTVDKGIVYIDDTSADTEAYPVVGQTYIQRHLFTGDSEWIISSLGTVTDLKEVDTWTTSSVWTVTELKEVS